MTMHLQRRHRRVRRSQRQPGRQPVPGQARVLVFAAILAALFVVAATPGCAKSPPSTRIPYDGAVGTGDAWNTSVGSVVLTIDPLQLGSSISPLIYGYNGVRDPGRYGVASLRAGGNRYTAYNWENNASNAGNDHVFQNDGYLVQGSTMADAPGQAVRPTLETARLIGAAAILTVPNVDYVAADKLADGDVSMSSADYLMTRFKQNRATKGAAFSATPDVSDPFVYQDEFVSWVGETFSDVPVLFSMDNEPDLWSSTHKEVHPQPVGYDELVRRNIEFARAVKSVWPWIPVLGFVSYGWQGFVSLQNSPDAGRGDFVEYYLDKLKADEAKTGKRAIDYLDLHWYPEAQGLSSAGVPTRIVFGGADNSADMIQARVQAPRSLWDPDYREQSWIVGAAHGPIALIPRMQNKINQHYPDTKLAFTEWNYGGGGDMSGAVATADVLGIFGREGVGAANIWPSGPETFNLAAVSAYRNFDGAGARFGDTVVAAQTTSILSSSVYAAVDANNQSRLVIVAINKRAEPTLATVKIVGDARQFASVWVLKGATPSLQPGASLVAASPGTFSYEMPPLSVTVMVPSEDLVPMAADGGSASGDTADSDAGVIPASAAVDGAATDDGGPESR